MKEFLPCDHMKLRDLPGVKSIYTVRDRKVPQSLDAFVMISLKSSTLALIPLKPG